jgi:hypothetical protein
MPHRHPILAAVARCEQLRVQIRELGGRVERREIRAVAEAVAEQARLEALLLELRAPGISEDDDEALGVVVAKIAPDEDEDEDSLHFTRLGRHVIAGSCFISCIFILLALGGIGESNGSSLPSRPRTGIDSTPW